MNFRNFVMPRHGLSLPDESVDDDEDDEFDLLPEFLREDLLKVILGREKLEVADGGPETPFPTDGTLRTDVVLFNLSSSLSLAVE